jgi:exodeoxyribonuclease-3
MQEIKCKPEQFPYAEFEAAGYTVEAHGLNQWNGVAIASREPIEDLQIGFPGMPGFAKGHDGPDAPQEARAIGATIGGIELWSLYVPNGRGLDDPHYTYNSPGSRRSAATPRTLRAQPDLARPHGRLQHRADRRRQRRPDRVEEGVTTHVSPPEREAFHALLDAGLHDTVRPLVPTGYTYWDYNCASHATRACASTSSSDRTRSPTPSSRHPSTATSARARSRATTCRSPSTSTSRGRTTTTGR